MIGKEIFTASVEERYSIELKQSITSNLKFIEDKKLKQKTDDFKFFCSEVISGGILDGFHLMMPLLNIAEIDMENSYFLAISNQLKPAFYLLRSGLENVLAYIYYTQKDQGNEIKTLDNRRQSSLPTGDNYLCRFNRVKLQTYIYFILGENYVRQKNNKTTGKDIHEGKKIRKNSSGSSRKIFFFGTFRPFYREEPISTW